MTSSRPQPTLIHDLTQGSVSRQLIQFATPLFFSGLLQTVYNMVDMVVVGHFIGSAGLSAVSVGGEILMLLTFVAMGLCNAGQVIIAQYVGAGRRDLVARLIGPLFTFLRGCAVLRTVLCLGRRGLMLGWVTCPPRPWTMARPMSRPAAAA